MDWFLKRFIEWLNFNQKVWLKQEIDMNTKLKQKAKYNF